MYSDMQYWEISSKTCSHLTAEEQEVYDPNTHTMTVKVPTVSVVKSVLLQCMMGNFDVCFIQMFVVYCSYEISAFF